MEISDIIEKDSFKDSLYNEEDMLKEYIKVSRKMNLINCP
jgi:hypothetical protein